MPRTEEFELPTFWFIATRSKTHFSLLIQKLVYNKTPIAFRICGSHITCFRSFDALVEVFPEIELKDYSNLSFTRDKVEVTNEDIENVKKNYLNSKAEMVEITDKEATVKESFKIALFTNLRSE